MTGEKTLKEAVHGIILLPKRYIIIPENEPSIPPRDPPPSSLGRSSAPGSSSHHARSPSPQPLNSGGVSDDDDIPPESPPKKAPKRSRAQASKPMQQPKEKQPRKKKAEPNKRKLAYEMIEEENEKVCREQLDQWFADVREKFRQKERERKEQIDPKKLKFFIKMK